ncbi:DNA damage response protein RcaA [Aspergillus mulundensis]|uniref:FHA domain-containing protein n=1 Tax=Aspergillus mulundensis TaxID=1810919 RepID=A0A3D8SLG2_9EURO|nr:Uncharacterized protein DSM5745_03758 [Aspergillus mulundensis]RDW87116.1 Uncharacterized protein DSM5745_03758 [Aspergillus mulundensis]
MWILDTEGEFLEGKRLWLRPGKKYLFGRFKADGVREAVPNDSVSRKHLTIEVSQVKAGDGSRTKTRSEILVTDEKSKAGTIVDGEKIKGSSKKLSGVEHIIYLGKSEHPLRIKWEPKVLSFSFSSKESNKNALARFRDRLEGYDIKTIEDYLINVTTHVVQTKRNTAKGLQALVNGTYIVDYSFVDALDYASTPSDLDSPESLSPLEADFDAAWPNANKYLPPPGKEVFDGSDESFAPNLNRINVFEDYIFVFCDKSQHQILKDPITNGHGKALYFDVEEGVTSPDEVVQFMRNAAGEKGIGSQRNYEGGVVLVRFKSKTGNQDWAVQLGNEVALMTDQRVIQQNEFLNAILGNDASILCRPLRHEIVPSSEPTPAPPSSDTVQAVADSQPSEEVSQPPKKVKSTRVRKLVTKMKAFDDGFDINSIPVYTQEADGPIEEMQPMSIDAPSEEPSQQIDNFQEEEDLVSSLLPGATAMKRRLGDTSQRRLDDSSTRDKPEEAPRPKRQKLDVLEAARQHREAEEDAARQRRQQEEELLQTSLQDVDVEKLRGLAIVEEMEVAIKPVDQGNDRWDERWNGRKNFKKFIRRRNRDSDQRQQQRLRLQTVIVPLEEVARKDFGIGDHYWVSNNRSSDRTTRESHEDRAVSQVPDSEPSQPRAAARKESQKTTTQRSQKRVREERDSDSDDELKFRFRRRR